MLVRNGLLFIGLAIISSTALADIQVDLQRGITHTDPCSQIAGNWQGNGDISYGYFVQCHYSGTAVVTSSSSSAFTFKAKLKKNSGMVCPAEEDIVLPGTCRNGVLNLQTTQANLKGAFGSGGKSADLTGTVTVPMDGEMVVVNVDRMHMAKV